MESDEELLKKINQSKYSNTNNVQNPSNAGMFCQICNYPAIYYCITCRTAYCGVKHLVIDDISAHVEICGQLSQLFRIQKLPMHEQQKQNIEDEIFELKQQCYDICYKKSQQFALNDNLEYALVAAERSYSFASQIHGVQSLYALKASLYVSYVSIQMGQITIVSENLKNAQVQLENYYQKIAKSIVPTGVISDLRLIAQIDPFHSYLQNNKAATENEFLNNSLHELVYRTQQGKFLAQITAQLKETESLLRSKSGDMGYKRDLAAYLYFTVISSGLISTDTVLALFKLYNAIQKDSCRQQAINILEQTLSEFLCPILKYQHKEMIQKHLSCKLSTQQQITFHRNLMHIQPYLHNDNETEATLKIISQFCYGQVDILLLEQIPVDKDSLPNLILQALKQIL
ncbi:Conserved_hypothetical protein [Hexamita inflata]|uniref:MYND-type domain-containing protein n=1 Tax=Hexamita inflata TaxID=28002 RepID=A0ABP1KUY6_9EUKA